MASKATSAWEKKLGIITAAADYEKDDKNHSRYEPTDYAVLERLAKSGLVTRENVLIDYGCGKGRVSFFMHYALGLRTIGIEYNPALHADAEINLKSYTGKRDGRIEFVCESAENYEIGDADCFYFFNPFSESILRSVLGRIYESYYTSPRPIKLFFYFPLDSYLSMLMTEDMLKYSGDIDCRDIFGSDDARERIVVFSIG